MGFTEILLINLILKVDKKGVISQEKQESLLTQEFNEEQHKFVICLMNI